MLSTIFKRNYGFTLKKKNKEIIISDCIEDITLKCKDIILCNNKERNVNNTIDSKEHFRFIKNDDILVAIKDSNNSIFKCSEYTIEDFYDMFSRNKNSVNEFICLPGHKNSQ